MTLEQWRDLWLTIYAIFWTLAGLVLLVLTILLYRRISALLDSANRVAKAAGAIAGVSAIVMQVIKALKGKGKEGG
ncbi:MAG: hypothetical protein HYX99_04190 [Chloroflexi bacterium]|nr:hypothetical protein [Chloroflexota bacterium]